MKVIFYYPCKYEYLHSQAHGPMGLTYMAAHLRQDLGIEDVQIEVDPDKIIAQKPDFVGVSAYTETFSMAIEGARKIKKALNIPIILGGYHISALPQTLPKDVFDLGVYGEGEKTLISLINTYQKTGWTDQSLAHIPGIIYFDKNNQLHITSPAPEIENLDDIYYPRRELMRAYWPPHQKEWIWQQAIYTSRGCPFRCTFCVHSMIDKFPRYHSPQRVLQELEDIIRYYPHQHSVTIHDDIFVISKKRLKILVDMLREAGIHKKLTFVSMIKPSAFDEEICHLLKQMNMGMIAFGLESASEPILKYLKGHGARQKQNQMALELCKKYNIKVCGYFILGSPAETKQDLSKTYWFIHQHLNAISTMGLFHLTPYPGTKFWHDYQARRPTPIAEMNWNLFDYRKADDPDTFFINEHYSPQYLKKVFDKFYELGSRLTICKSEKEEEIKHYKQSVYPYFAKQCQIRDRILEVSSLHDSFKELVKTSPFELQHVQPTDIFALEKKHTYTKIFINHALEQMPEPEKFIHHIKNYTSPQTKIYLSVYNSQFLPFIASLIGGLAPEEFFEPLELNQFHRYYSIKQLDILFNDYHLKVIYSVKQNIPHQLHSLRTCLEQVHTDKKPEYETFSYLIEMTSLKSPNL